MSCNNFKNLIVLFILVIIFFINVSAQDKISATEILTKHLDSIGTKDSRNSLKSIMIAGTSRATFKGRGAGMADGFVVLASEGDKSLIGMKFENAEYPFEMAGYDGNRVSAKQIRPGERTVLGDFLRLHQSVFESGVMSGALSQAWALYNFDEKKGKIKFAGIQKNDDKQFYKLNYSPKKGGGLDINLFFEIDTFRHARTEYKRVLSSSIGGGVDNSARQNETRYTMIEDFSDFKAKNKLNLPHRYRLFLEIISGNGTISYEWQMELQNFIFNEPIDMAQFKLDGN